MFFSLEVERGCIYLPLQCEPACRLNVKSFLPAFDSSGYLQVKNIVMFFFICKMLCSLKMSKINNNIVFPLFSQPSLLTAISSVEHF